ncbi:MAG: hypothetical protein WAO35_02865 [Terriglobia bacterium]
MSLYVKRMGRTVLLFFLVLGIGSAVALGQARKKSKAGGGSGSLDDYLKPQLLNADSNPTLRYPVASFSGWSVKSTSYGWFDVTRNAIRYSVVQPADKISEGFEMSTGEIIDLKIEQMYLMFHRGSEKKKYMIFYLSQDRWGMIHSGPGAIQAASVGALGTSSMFQAVRNFDNVLAMVKPPAPVVVAPISIPPPEPKPAEPPPPPAIVVASPSGAGPNQTVESNQSSLVIRGVAMDSTGIPVVSINGVPANIRPQNNQAAEFWSDPLPLQPGANPIQIAATNSAHVEAKIAFTVHYAPKAAPVNPKALDKAEIISLLVGGVPPSRVAEILRERGIKFVPAADDLNEIRAAGGSDELTQAIQEVAAHP